MKTSRIFGLATTLVLLAAVSARAADETADIIKEFKGEAPAQKRSAEELQAAYAKVIDAMIPGMAGAGNETVISFENICFNASRPGAEGQRVALCKAIVPKLVPATPQLARVWLIRQLQHIGKAECVESLAALLGDKDAEVAECARRALQKNSSAEAGAALRAALDKAITPAAQVAFMNAVGNRKDVAAVASIAKLVGDKTPAVAVAAVRALGDIGTSEAAAAIQPALMSADAHVKSAAADAYLLCADALLAAGKKDLAAGIYTEMFAPVQTPIVRVAALKGLAASQGEKAVGMLCEAIMGSDVVMSAAAIQYTADVPGAEATKAFAARVAKLSPVGQKALISTLGARGDVAAKPAILEAGKSTDEAVRAAAIAALGTLGDASDVEMLAQTAASAAADAPAARAALIRLNGKDVDAALMKAMESGETKVRVEVIKALAIRKTASAMPAMMKAAEDADGIVASEALNALSNLADEKCLPALIALLAKVKDSQISTLEGAIGSVVSRVESKDACSDQFVAAAGGAKGPARCALVRLMGRTGGAKALAAVQAALKDAAPEVQEAAIRALADWPDVVAAADLLAIAKDDKTKKNLQVVALRGYIRLAGATTLKAEDRLKMYQAAMALARTDEKRSILPGLGELNSPEALAMIAPCLDDKDLAAEASAAAVSVAKNLNDKSAGQIKAVMEKVLVVCKSKQVKEDAQKQLDRATKALKGKK